VVSRRAAERLVAAGRVTVNGERVTDAVVRVGTDDRVAIDGEMVAAPDFEEYVYIMLHKPVGVLSTMAPSRETGIPVSQLVDLPVRLHTVGRLDRDSCGLLLLTNDGELTHCLTHPRHHVTKEYALKLDHPLTPADVGKLERGVLVEGRAVEVDDLRPMGGNKIAITIHEGRKRILRRLMRELGRQVIELKRVRIGPLTLGKLGIGKWRKLTAREVEALRRAANSDTNTTPL